MRQHLNKLYKHRKAISVILLVEILTSFSLFYFYLVTPRHYCTYIGSFQFSILSVNGVGWLEFPLFNNVPKGLYFEIEKIVIVRYPSNSDQYIQRFDARELLKTDSDFQWLASHTKIYWLEPPLIVDDILIDKYNVTLTEFIDHIGEIRSLPMRHNNGQLDPTVGIVLIGVNQTDNETIIDGHISKILGRYAMYVFAECYIPRDYYMAFKDSFPIIFLIMIFDIIIVGIKKFRIFEKH